MFQDDLAVRRLQQQIDELEYRRGVDGGGHRPSAGYEVLEKEQASARAGHPPHLGEQPQLGRGGLVVHDLHAEDQIEALVLVGEEQVGPETVEGGRGEVGPGARDPLLACIQPKEARPSKIEAKGPAP
ncbi:MAG TPA: hypothetical protein VFV45_00465, partial [Rubrobacteraceae bacterium]|nr:hypothetical protein [Rubrobacteraceae bacterium]